MPRYIAVHPGSLGAKALKGLVERHDEIPEDTLLNRTWSGVAEPVTYSDWEALDAEAVAGVLGRFGISCSGIHEVAYFRADETWGQSPTATAVHCGSNGRRRRFMAVLADSLDETSLETLLRRSSDTSRDVSWRCAWSGLRERVSYCEWEAPTAESVASVVGGTGVPCAALHEVRCCDHRLSICHDPERPVSATVH